MKEGFVRPTWFTTSRRITDANYRRTSLSNFHLANASKKVISHTKFGGSIVGIMQEDFNAAMEASKQGVLIVGPPEIAAQVAGKISEAVFSRLKTNKWAYLHASIRLFSRVNYIASMSTYWSQGPGPKSIAR
ncbi:MAG: hypothetical protein ABW141_15405 [Candidatus Thiodiazotropha endolucinida]